MGNDHRCFDIFVTEQFLHGSDTCPTGDAGIVAALEKMGYKGMAKSMGTDTFGDRGLARCKTPSSCLIFQRKGLENEQQKIYIL